MRYIPALGGDNQNPHSHGRLVVVRRPWALHSPSINAPACTAFYTALACNVMLSVVQCPCKQKPSTERQKMKKIIQGRKYNTETAKPVGEYEFDYPTSIHYYCETLFKKRNGEYFIYGEGGAGSKYSESRYGGNCAGSGRIVPMSYDNARDWAEENLDTEAYEAEFGEVSEDGTDEVMLSVRISPSARAKLDRIAATSGKAKGKIVSEAIESLAEC